MSRQSKVSRCAYVCLVALSAFVVTAASAQTNVSTDTARFALLNSLALISGTSQPIVDVTMNGTIARSAGDSSDTVVATLTGKGTGASRIDSPLSAVVHSETSARINGLPICEWTDAKGASHLSPSSNCAVAVWFFPQLSPLASVQDSTTQVLFVGHEKRGTEPVDHYTIIQNFSATSSKAAIQSQVEVYLDSATQIPVALAFQTHPDNDLKTNLAMEVRFSDYRSVNGVLVPFRVTKALNGATVFDFTATDVTFNSGVSDSQFALQ